MREQLLRTWQGSGIGQYITAPNTVSIRTLHEYDGSCHIMTAVPIRNAQSFLVKYRRQRVRFPPKNEFLLHCQIR